MLSLRIFQLLHSPQISLLNLLLVLVFFSELSWKMSSYPKDSWCRLGNFHLPGHSAGSQLLSHFAKPLCSCSSLGLGTVLCSVPLAEAVYLLYPWRNKARQLSLHQLMGNAHLHCWSNLSTSTSLSSNGGYCRTSVHFLAPCQRWKKSFFSGL